MTVTLSKGKVTNTAVKFDKFGRPYLDVRLQLTWQDTRLPPGVTKVDYYHRHQPTCPACGGPMPKAAYYHKGRRRRTCGNPCKQAAYRRRKAGVPEDAPRIYHNEALLR